MVREYCLALYYHILVKGFAADSVESFQHSNVGIFIVTCSPYIKQLLIK